MTNADSQPGEICRNALLQLAVYGIAGQGLSVERLLDRMASPDRPDDEATPRRLGTQ
ncbi:MAG: hypothetical protein RKE52_04720 [Marinovum algicola]|jgi:hypothetical protein|uniref:hypothetical protein n=1 Tax=Marinovum algicola TaxID=42444 RepID=UPI0032EFF019